MPRPLKPRNRIAGPGDPFTEIHIGMGGEGDSGFAYCMRLSPDGFQPVGIQISEKLLSPLSVLNGSVETARGAFQKVLLERTGSPNQVVEFIVDITTPRSKPHPVDVSADPFTRAVRDLRHIHLT